MKKLIWKIKFTYHMYIRVKGGRRWLAVCWECANESLLTEICDTDDDPEEVVIEELSYWTE